MACIASCGGNLQSRGLHGTRISLEHLPSHSNRSICWFACTSPGEPMLVDLTKEGGRTCHTCQHHQSTPLLPSSFTLTSSLPLLTPPLPNIGLYRFLWHQQAGTGLPTSTMYAYAVAKCFIMFLQQAEQAKHMVYQSKVSLGLCHKPTTA